MVKKNYMKYLNHFHLLFKWSYEIYHKLRKCYWFWRNQEEINNHQQGEDIVLQTC
jgi:hypothetical protein